MWSGKLTGHKVGNNWRFFQTELRACVRVASPTGIQEIVQEKTIPSDEGQAKVLVAASY
jgi:hypothetical protein